MGKRVEGSMSTYTLDTATSRAHPTPVPMKRLTVPMLQERKGVEPIVMLTAYTARMAQLLDPHCDLLLVGDSLGLLHLRQQRLIKRRYIAIIQPKEVKQIGRASCRERVCPYV